MKALLSLRDTAILAAAVGAFLGLYALLPGMLFTVAAGSLTAVGLVVLGVILLVPGREREHGDPAVTEKPAPKTGRHRAPRPDPFLLPDARTAAERTQDELREGKWAMPELPPAQDDPSTSYAADSYPLTDTGVMRAFGTVTP
jgi:hypothetical protein